MNQTPDNILQNLLDGILIVDSHGLITYSNRAAEQLFELSADELKGKPFGFPIIIPYEVQEIEIMKSQEVISVQMLASQISWNEQKASLLSLRDITVQKRSQEELALRQQLIEKTSEENAQYAAMASHDLRAPVRKIKMFSNILLNKGLLETHESIVKSILASARRMESLIDGISELSNINYRENSFSYVNLNLILDEVREDMEPQIIEKKAEIDIHELPIIMGNENALYRLFLNLFSNSLKYCKADTAPIITVKEQESDDEAFICIECSDNGIGFDNIYGKQMFQPFQRLHSAEYGGVGIGLALCQKIIDVHKGNISAEGADGVGARFTIRLPRTQTSAA